MVSPGAAGVKTEPSDCGPSRLPLACVAVICALSPNRSVLHLWRCSASSSDSGRHSLADDNAAHQALDVAMAGAKKRSLRA
jgi:hypothetical protein